MCAVSDNLIDIIYKEYAKYLTKIIIFNYCYNWIAAYVLFNDYYNKCLVKQVFLAR